MTAMYEYLIAVSGQSFNFNEPHYSTLMVTAETDQQALLKAASVSSKWAVHTQSHTIKQKVLVWTPEERNALDNIRVSYEHLMIGYNNPYPHKADELMQSLETDIEWLRKLYKKRFG